MHWVSCLYWISRWYARKRLRKLEPEKILLLSSTKDHNRLHQNMPLSSSTSVMMSIHLYMCSSSILYLPSNLVRQCFCSVCKHYLLSLSFCFVGLVVLDILAKKRDQRRVLSILAPENDAWHGGLNCQPTDCGSSLVECELGSRRVRLNELECSWEIWWLNILVRCADLYFEIACVGFLKDALILPT